MDEAQALTELDGLLARLYSPECTNNDRLEINKLLDSFGQQEGVWIYCVHFLSHSSNEYTYMYALHVIENIITLKWMSVPTPDRLKIRQFLMDFLVTKFATLAKFVRNKLVQLVVLVGRVDWPHDYPEFLDYILQLVHGSDTRLLGLSLLKAVSEELGTPKSDLIPSSRRHELHQLVLQHVPTILHTLVQILDSALVLPSPTQPSLVFKLDPDTCKATLTCIGYFFSWIPLSSLVTPSILDVIFRFAGLGCYSAKDSSEHSGELGSTAMDCINELLMKSCVPREFEAFLMQLFNQSFTLLQRLTDGRDQGKESNFSRMDDRYLAKCGDFFYWFVSSHLKRVEFNLQFPVLEFLTLFYKYTFKQPEIDNFCVCLDTWGVFLDHLILMAEDAAADHSPHSHKHYERYKDVLVSMMTNVLRKIQLHFNIDELREVDDDTIDDDNETEWQSFLRQCLEFVGKVAELFPHEAFHLIVPLTDDYSQVYFTVAQLVSQQGNDRVLGLSAGVQCEQLHAVLKDLTSMLQALGRLADHFCGSHFIERLNEAQTLVNKFCTLAQYSAEHVLFNIDTPVPEILEHDFIELHAQILGTLQAYQHWLSELYLSSLRHQQPSQGVSLLVSAVVEATVPVISHEIPEKVALSASRLLLSLASTVRPCFLARIPAMRGLLDKAASGQLKGLPLKVHSMTCEALTAMLVLPWPSLSEQEWELRFKELCRTVQGSTTFLQHITGTPGWEQNSSLQQQAKPEIKKTLVLLGDMVKVVEHDQPKPKSIMYRAIESTIQTVIPFFHIYLSQPDLLDTLMGFLLTIVRALACHASPVLTDSITQTFMTLLTRRHLEDSILLEGSVGNKVVEKFLQILELLVKENSSSGKESFLPGIIAFTLKQIYPAVSPKELPEVKCALYQLLNQVLLSNWRYFFPTSVLNHMDDTDEPTAHQDEFIHIMEAFGQSFLQMDITVFKQNIQALESLNSKHKLFSKAAFRASMWQPFLQVLLQVLVQKSHDLLQEEILSCIYSMASVDFAAFHTEFLPAFLGDVDGLNEEQKVLLVEQYKIVQDSPSFVLNLRQFTNDLRYFILLNTSLPAHSVKLR